MSATMNFYVHGRFEGSMKVTSEASIAPDGRQYSNVTMQKGSTVLNIFVDNIQDLDRIAAEFATLTRVAREAWSQVEQTGTAQ